jgi:RNAse (barnase) inhibitor barstar
MGKAKIDTKNIYDWPSFHQEFKVALGFPEFYGANMDAWIDCMSCVNDPSAKMSRITIKVGELLIVELNQTKDFKKRCLEQFHSLVECTTFVNQRFPEPLLALVFK